MKKNVVIIGGGVIGLSIGWQLARAGTQVKLYEKGTAGRGASWVSAGMLAPETEAGYEDAELLQLGMESLKLYPKFLDELQQDSHISVELREEGTLIVALDRDDTERLQTFFDFRKSLGLPIRWLLGSEAREMEPLLSSKTVSAVSIPRDWQTNPRQLSSALQVAFKNQGGELHENTPVEEVLVRHGQVVGIRTKEESIEAEQVVLAAGCWSSEIAGIPEELRPPVRPMKGQVIQLRKTDSCTISHVVRGPEAYLVPKLDGRIVLGATTEDVGYDLLNTAGPLLDLLQGAYEIIPAIYECAIEEIQAGLRPGTRDNLPILGETPIEGLYCATGHYRNGILLTPITAYEMSRLILGESSSTLAPFQLSRFVPVGVGV